MRRPVVLVVAAVVATAATVVGGVLAVGRSGEEKASTPEEPSFSTTPLAEFDTTDTVVARGRSATRSTTARSTRRSARSPRR